jgi:putative redox protein
MRNVTVGRAEGKLAQDIEVAGHRIRSDEEIEKGGEDTGATPHELLLAALGSCTAMTLKVYADRKGWPLRDAHVLLNAANADGGYVISRQVTLAGDLDAEQRQRLMEIADRCPVHKTLSGSITITTTAGTA